MDNYDHVGDMGANKGCDNCPKNEIFEVSLNKAKKHKKEHNYQPLIDVAQRFLQQDCQILFSMNEVNVSNC